MGYVAHDTDLHIIGSGIMYFDRWDSDELPTGMRDLGNGTACAGGVELENKDHFQKRSGVRTRDLRINLSKSLYFNITLDEYDQENLALSFLGTITSDIIYLLDSSQIRGEFRFIGDPAHGPAYYIDLWKCLITPTGVVDFLSDDWGLENFRIDIESDEANHPLNPYGIAYRIVSS